MRCEGPAHGDMYAYMCKRFGSDAAHVLFHLRAHIDCIAHLNVMACGRTDMREDMPTHMCWDVRTRCTQRRIALLGSAGPHGHQC